MAQGFGTRVLRGFFLMAGAGGVQAGLQLVALVVLARLLAPEVFGAIMPVSALFALISAFLTAGMIKAVVRHRELPHEIFRFFVQYLVVGSLTAALLANLVLLVLPAAAARELWIAHALTLLFPLLAVRAYANAVLARQLAFRALALLNTASIVFYVSSALILATTVGGAAALVVPLLLQWTVYLPYCAGAPLGGIGRRPSAETLRELGALVGPMTGATICTDAAARIDQVAAGLHDPVTAGFYNRSSMLAQAPARIMQTIGQQLGLAAVAKLQDDRTRLTRAYLVAVAVFAVMGLPLSVFVVLNAEALLVVVLGTNWAPAADVFLILATIIYFRLIKRLYGSLLLGASTVSWYFWSQLIFLLLNVALLFTVGAVSIWWLAVMFAACRVVDFVLLNLLARQVVTVTLGDFARAHLGGVVLAGLVGAACLGVDWALVGAAVPLWVDLTFSAFAAGLLAAALLFSRRLAVFGQEHAWLERESWRFLADRARQLGLRLP